jgi:hypothetical protein
MKVKERVRAIPLLPLWAFVACSGGNFKDHVTRTEGFEISA